jgi:hypothetical protein
LRGFDLLSELFPRLELLLCLELLRSLEPPLPLLVVFPCSFFRVGLLLRPLPSDFDFGPLPEGFDRFLSFCCVAILRAELPFSRQVGLRAEFPWIEKANRWAGDANI